MNITLLELLKKAKEERYLYSSIPFTCGIDEAISYVKYNLPNDKGFSEKQLTIIKKDSTVVFEVRKSEKHKRCFSFKVFR